MTAPRLLLILTATIALSGCGEQAAESASPQVDRPTVAPVTSRGEAKVTVHKTKRGLDVRVEGADLRQAARELAQQTGLAIRIEDKVPATQLHIRYSAGSAAQALKTLAKLGGVTLERETLAGQRVYRFGGEPHSIFLIDVWNVLLAISLVFLAFLADRVVEVILRRREQASRRKGMRFKQFAPLIRVGLWVFAGVSAFLVLLRVPPSTALALTGGSLLLIGFASREFAANILSGLAIALDRPLHLGDFVKVGDYSGEVVRIGLRSTQIVTLDDTMITIPNNVVATEMVASANYGAIDALIEVTFHVSHTADVAKVRALVWEGVVTSAYCSWRRPVHVIVSEVPWATRVVAQAYVFDVRHQLLFVTDVTHRVKRAFETAGIPYPAFKDAPPGAQAAIKMGGG